MVSTCVYTLDLKTVAYLAVQILLSFIAKQAYCYDKHQPCFPPAACQRWSSSDP